MSVDFRVVMVCSLVAVLESLRPVVTVLADVAENLQKREAELSVLDAEYDHLVEEEFAKARVAGEIGEMFLLTVVQVSERIN